MLWEYQVADFTNKSLKQRLEFLQVLGISSWELVSIDVVNGWFSSKVTATFKRPLR